MLWRKQQFSVIHFTFIIAVFAALDPKNTFWNAYRSSFWCPFSCTFFNVKISSFFKMVSTSARFLKHRDIDLLSGRAQCPDSSRHVGVQFIADLSSPADLGLSNMEVNSRDLK